MLYQQTAILLIPFLGTSLGSAMVFFTKNKINEKFQKFLLGFASGVMIAASVWSLIIPSVEMSAKQNVIEWLPAAVGFLLGIGFLLLLDSVIPHLHLNSDKPEGVKSRLSKNTMLVLAVTLHNIPEGMAVGVTLAGAITENTGITGRCDFTCSRNCNSEFPGGSNNISAAQRRRLFKVKIILLRRDFGCG